MTKRVLRYRPSLHLTGALLLVASTSFSAAISPFPRNANYAFGIRASNASSDASEVQAAYIYWLSNWYVEEGAEARIAFDDKSSTVSEGIGYGMLIMVYMDNAMNDTRSKFDKLWTYYRNRLDKYGLMNWKYSGFGSSPTGSYAATDAELDVALALLMAYKQWGAESYLADAKDLIEKIWTREVNHDLHLLKSGDAWDTYRNPSYFSMAALRLFASSGVSTKDWSMVIERSYRMLRANASSSHSAARLPSDWSDSAGTGKPVGGNSGTWFSYDAVRTPWRMALAYSWFGDTAAQALAADVAAFANSSSHSIQGNPANVVDGYDLDGSKKGSWNVATFVGALGCAGMASNAYQSWVNASYKRLFTQGCDSSSYYHASLKLLYELHLSGNFNNLWAGSTSASRHVAARTRRMVRLEDGHLLVDVPSPSGRIETRRMDGRIPYHVSAPGSESHAGDALRKESSHE